MDVTCAKCQEPWDFYHLMHDAIYETDLPEAVIRQQWKSELTPVFEEALQREGWRFIGHSLLAIAQCPACKDQPDTAEGRQRAEMRGVLAELLGDDLDGLACHLEDLDQAERQGRL